jgi:hypothetical protein
MTEHARAALQDYLRQLERFEPILPTHDEMAYNSDKFHSGDKSGLLFLRLALDKARCALVSRNDKQIIEAAIDCGQLVLDGCIRSFRHDRRMRAKTAGKASGQKRAAKFRDAHTDEQRRWNDLCAKHGRSARGIHLRELAAKGIVISERQHRNKYPAQTKPETN